MSYDAAVYKFNTDYQSPCDDSDGSCASTMATDFSWAIDQESYGAIFFDLALGLPFSIETSVEEFNYVEIGTSAGIPTAKLHDDYVAFTDEYYNESDPEPANSGIILSGGSYKTGRNAGTWTMELFKNSNNSQFKDVGFRCVIPLKEKNYLEAQFGEGVKNHAP